MERYKQALQGRSAFKFFVGVVITAAMAQYNPNTKGLMMLKLIILNVKGRSYTF